MIFFLIKPFYSLKVPLQPFRSVFGLENKNRENKNRTENFKLKINIKGVGLKKCNTPLQYYFCPSFKTYPKWKKEK